MWIQKQNDTDSLKAHLERLGYRFPCAGKGLCGRCRITAPALPVTPLDKRFLSARDIQNGVRLACDKTIDADFELTNCTLPLAKAKQKPLLPQVAAIILPESVEISIIDDEILETVRFPKAADTLSLRAVIGKNAVEFFEEYHVPQAVTLLVAGAPRDMACFTAETGTLAAGAFFPAARFDMPAEEVYLPPTPNASVGSRHLLELLAHEAGDLLYFPEDALFIYMDVEHIYAGIAPIRFLAAAAVFFKNKFRMQQVFVVTDDAALCSTAFAALTASNVFPHHAPPAATQAACEALLENRCKTRLNKLARQTVLLDLANEDLFQTLLSGDV